MENDIIILALYNIPNEFDTFSLRQFFHKIVCSGAFHLFHFKNRPEINLSKILQTLCPSIKLYKEICLQSNEQPEICSTITFDFNSYLSKTKVKEASVSRINLNSNCKSAFLQVYRKYYNELMGYNGLLWHQSEGSNGAASHCCIISLPGMLLCTFSLSITVLYVV